MTALIDLSDVGIAIDGLNNVVEKAPGYAYLPNDDEPLFGHEAVSVAKLHPTQINNRFWADLSTEPTNLSHPKIRHNADLAWFHLKKIKPMLENTAVVLIVPSSYDQQTLKLLAGVCQSLEISVAAFVDRAVASCIGHADVSESQVFVDLQQHQTLLTFLETQNGELKKVRVEQIPAHGLVRLQERWLHILRQRYINASRFDPMHSGDTEQQLFSQLNEFLSGSKNDKFDFAISLDDQNLQESFSEDELAQPYKDLLSEIRGKAEKLPLVLDSFFGGLPGVDTGDGIQLASAESVFVGAQHIAAEMSDSTGDIGYFSSGRVLSSSNGAHQSDLPSIIDSGANNNSATHILLNGYAYPGDYYDIKPNGKGLALVPRIESDDAHIRLRGQQLELGSRASELSLNHLAGVEGTLLHPGDVISFGKAAGVINAIAFKEMEK